MKFVEGFIVCGEQWGHSAGSQTGLLIFIFGLSLFLHLDLNGLFLFIEVHAWYDSGRNCGGKLRARHASKFEWGTAVGTRDFNEDRTRGIPSE